MKKTILFALCATFLSASNAGSPEIGPDEMRLIQSAEEISASEMDDDEKIGRLTQIEARVREIRKRRVLAETSALPPITGSAAESSRPVSTFVRKQTEETLSPTPGIPADERGPTPLVRMGYWIMRLVGWALVVGISAAALLFLAIAVTAFFERLEGRRKAHPQKSAVTADFVTRDGVVPERLR